MLREEAKRDILTVDAYLVVEHRNSVIVFQLWLGLDGPQRPDRGL